MLKVVSIIIPIMVSINRSNEYNTHHTKYSYLTLYSNNPASHLLSYFDVESCFYGYLYYGKY